MIPLPDIALDLVLAYAAALLAHRLTQDLPHQLLDLMPLHSILGVTSTELVPYATTVGLHLLPHCKLSVAAKQGRFDILRMRRQYRITSDPDDVDEAVIWASRTGDMKSLEWLLDHESHENLLTVPNIVLAMSSASETVQIDVLRFWEARSPFPPQEILNFDVDYVLDSACRGGSVQVLSWWLEHAHDRNRFSSPQCPRTLTMYKHTSALSWWYRTCAVDDPAEYPLLWPYKLVLAFVQAASPELLQEHVTRDRLIAAITLMGCYINDRLATFDRDVMTELSQKPNCAAELTWWRKMQGLTRKQLRGMVQACTRKATCAALDWWWDVGLPRREFRNLARSAALSGHIDLLLTKPVHDHRDHAYSILLHGSLSVVQWYHRRGMYFVIHPATICALSLNNRVHVLDWMARTPELAFPCAESGAIDVASIKYEQAALNWWLQASRDPALPPGRVTFDYTHRAMDRARTPGALDWWMQSGLPLKYSTDALLHATWHCRTDVLAWWQQSGLPLKYSDDLFDSLNAEEHLWAAVQIKKHIYQERMDQVAALNAAARKGWVDQTQVGAPTIPFLRWWEHHFLTDEPLGQLEIVEQDKDQLPEQRARWLKLASPPSYWKRIRRVAKR
ncbi:hypothetical protein BC828DRAFT_397129 [Blastocladiella britannica]|nr:hypothetical protein BC828DRAFT_397129 [Blastocladiella britannica]